MLERLQKILLRHVGSQTHYGRNMLFSLFFSFTHTYMIFTYCRANGSGHKAAWLHQIAFPERRKMSHPTFAVVIFLKVL